jgi:tetratricopeptide (TPR) repeat protein
MREKIGDLTNIAKYYQLIGEVYKQLGQKEKWREYFIKADSLSRENELYANFFTKVGIMNDMGGFYESDGELGKAKVTYEQMYALCEKEQYANGMTVALSNLVPVLKKMGLKQEALEKSLMALSISQKSDRAYHIIYNLNNVGEQYLELGKPSSALPYFLSAESMADSKSFPWERMQSWKGVYRSYKLIGNYKKALEYFEQEVQLSDSLKGVEVKKNVAELETRYETEKKEQQIRELSLRTELDKKKVRALVGFVSASVVLIVLLIYIVRIRRRTILQQRELIVKQREVAHLNQEKLKFELGQKNRELSSLALQMASKSEFVNELKSKMDSGIDSVGLDRIIREIEIEFNSESDWDAFRLRFEEVHPSFFKLLKKQFSDLTSGELKLCALLQLNLTTKEIANINNITTAAVDKSRNRLRKKLNLTPEESLNDFLSRF